MAEKEKEIKVEEQPKPKRVMIATPMYGGMCTGHYVQGLISSIHNLRSNGYEVFWSQMMNESLITRARNELTRLFLANDFDYLMFVDADIGFEGDAILTLLKADCDVACGLYPKKEVDWKAVKRAASEGKEDLEKYGGAFVFNMCMDVAETNESGMIEVRHSGTGFMLIKKEVFHKLRPHVPTYRISTIKDPETDRYMCEETHEFFSTSIDHTGALLSEDYHFCELWRAHGGKVHANPFIRLSHIGSYVFEGDIVKAGGNLK